jgi:transcriptional activator protein UGA3
MHPDWQANGQQDLNETTARRHAMRYYIEVLSSLLTVSAAHNSFVSAFLPMAIESPTLANALIAYSSSHMCTTDASYATVSMRARSRALSGLAQDLALGCSQSSSIEVNVAVCMILLTSEVCEGNYDAWYTHLLGAKQLLLSGAEQDRPSFQALKHSTEGQWILRNFAYHDIVGSVTSGTRPSMDAIYLQDIGDVVDTYLGVATPVLVFISAISNLDCVNPAAIVEAWDKCLGIREDLETWSCPRAISVEYISMAYAYRGAAMIYLYRKMRYIQKASMCSHSSVCPELITSYDVEELIHNEASKTLNYIMSIPVDDTTESALLFPLFLAGGEVLKEAEIGLVRERLRGMYRKRRFRNILRAWQTLESLWALRQNDDHNANVRADWQQVVNTQNMGLLLLT